MSREEEIKKIDEELEKLGQPDEKEPVEEVEEEEKDEGEETKEPEKAVDEEQKVEEKKIELKAPEIPDSTLGYKLREEARRREAAEARVAELEKPKISKEENYEAHIEQEIGMTKSEIADLKKWKNEQEAEKQMEAQREGAFRELRGYEQEAAAAFDDFEPAANYVKAMIAASIKLLEPNISPDDLAQKTVYKYAEQAAIALNAKKHPGQAIYEAAAQWGYKKAEERPSIETKQDNRPSIAKIGENKKKSSGMSGTGGNGVAFPNMDAVSKMTNAERMKLSESDWARLEAEG